MYIVSRAKGAAGLTSGAYHALFILWVGVDICEHTMGHIMTRLFCGWGYIGGHTKGACLFPLFFMHEASEEGGVATGGIG
eukprot:366201-Chlamydomonas_euryale.AAC.3